MHLTVHNDVYPLSRVVPQLVKKFFIMEPEGSLPWSQQLAISTYPESN